MSGVGVAVIVGAFVGGAVAGGLVVWLLARAQQAADAARLDAERRAHADQLATRDDAGRSLREAFQTLAAEALRHNNQSFLDLARERLGAIQDTATRDLEGRQTAITALLAPIRETLAQVDTKLADVEKARVGAYAGLSEQVRSLIGTQQRLHTETSNLVSALRTPHVRGRWGELQLRRVVELAEMLPYCDFIEQETIEGDDGRLRPDLIVRLPGGKHVVVDAKAPLAAYLDAIEAPDDATREAKLRDHARQVRDHITKLAAKSYWDRLPTSPDFVVMFLPGESFFSAALQADPSLLEAGVVERVVPASPTTLIALLRAVAYGWRQERIAESAREVSELGAQLHDRLGTLIEHFEGVGKSLDKAVQSYNRAVGSFENRVLVSARKLKDLGVTVNADLPVLDPIERTARALESGDLFEQPGGMLPPPTPSGES